VEVGITRDAEARDALGRAEALIDRGDIEEGEFVEAARALTRARRNVEGRDG
jgi:hypothetical protein